MSGSSRPTASPEPSPPLWARALLALDRTAARGAALRQEMRDELLWAWTTPSDRDAVTLSTYASDARYVQGGQFFERGLFPWETDVLAFLRLPSGSRVLVGGAGGGRETWALARAGFVTAFEPCAQLADAADVDDEGALRRARAPRRIRRSPGGGARGGGPRADRRRGTLCFGPSRVAQPLARPRRRRASRPLRLARADRPRRSHRRQLHASGPGRGPRAPPAHVPPRACGGGSAGTTSARRRVRPSGGLRCRPRSHGLRARCLRRRTRSPATKTRRGRGSSSWSRGR